MRKQPVCRGPLAGTGRAAETVWQHREPGGVGEVCAPGHRDAGGTFDDQRGAHSISEEDPGQTRWEEADHAYTANENDLCLELDDSYVSFKRCVLRATGVGDSHRDS